MLIDHPARQGENATILQWLRFHVSQWMLRVAQDMEHAALYPNDKRCPECGGWISPMSGEGHRTIYHPCDHIPF